MADQLYGVLREVVARETGAPAPAPSTIFTAELRGAVTHADWRVLPALLVASDDPASGYLATLATTTADPGDLADELAKAPVPSVEVMLRRANALIDAGRPEEAEAVLGEVEAGDEWEWRVYWYRGLLALSRDEPALAVTAFDRVFRTVPGELAPRLALGYAHERGGHPGAAAEDFDVVSQTDPGLTSAVFGLARCLLAVGDRAGGVAAYDRVPPSSSAFSDAQIAKIEALVDEAWAPGLEDAVTAGRIAGALTLPSEERARLSALVFHAALLAFGRAPRNEGQGTLLGRPLTETGVRQGLERAYREMARHASTAQERIRLTDRANEARPRSWW
jgi:serine/threonine-protein kinase PknG